MKQRVRFQAHEGAGREGNMGGVASLAWSRDGNVLVSGGEDTSILVWDVTTLMGQGRSRPADLTPRELEGLWGDLAGEEAGKAYRAIGRLITSPRTAGGFLGKQLHPATDLRGIARLIRDLDDDRSPVRENATRELEGLGRSAESALRQALAGKPSLEVRRRLERLLERFEERALTPQELRSVRAIEVLERLGTSEARDVLRGLARGAPPAYVTREAKAALERLARR